MRTYTRLFGAIVRRAGPLFRHRRPIARFGVNHRTPVISKQPVRLSANPAESSRFLHATFIRAALKAAGGTLGVSLVGFASEAFLYHMGLIKSKCRNNMALDNEQFYICPRQSALASLSNTIQTNKAALKLVVITGRPGTGKSTIARLYADSVSKARWHFERHVAWIMTAESVENIHEEYTRFAARVFSSETRNSGDVNALIDGVQEGLRQSTDFVLIFDNVTNIADIVDYIPRPEMGLSGTVVITTTSLTNILSSDSPSLQDMTVIDLPDRGIACHWPMPSMTRDDILEYLSKNKHERCSAPSSDDIELVISTVGDEPYDLRLVATQMRQRLEGDSSQPLQSFRQVFASIRNISQRTLGLDHFKTALRTMLVVDQEMPLVQTTGRNITDRDAIRLLQMIQLLGADDIPLSLINAFWQQNYHRNPDTALSMLEHWGFIHYTNYKPSYTEFNDQQAIKVHRTVQFHLRQIQKEVANLKPNQSIFQNPEVSQEQLLFFLTREIAGDSRDVERLIRNAALIPHAEILLAANAGSIEHQLKLRRLIAHNYMQRDDYLNAYRSLMVTHDQLSQLSDTSGAVMTKFKTLRYLGRYSLYTGKDIPEGITYLQQAIELLTPTKGEDHLEVAIARNDLANLLMYTHGGFDQAKTLFIKNILRPQGVDEKRSSWESEAHRSLFRLGNLCVHHDRLIDQLCTIIDSDDLTAMSRLVADEVDLTLDSNSTVEDLFIAAEAFFDKSEQSKQKAEKDKYSPSRMIDVNLSAADFYLQRSQGNSNNYSNDIQAAHRRYQQVIEKYTNLRERQQKFESTDQDESSNFFGFRYLARAHCGCATIAYLRGDLIKANDAISKAQACSRIYSNQHPLTKAISQLEDNIAAAMVEQMHELFENNTCSNFSLH